MTRTRFGVWATLALGACAWGCSATVDPGGDGAVDGAIEGGSANGDGSARTDGARPDGSATLDGGGGTGDGGGTTDGGATGAEQCNGVDDDNDGLVDEDLLEICGTDVGACVAGVRRCVSGAFTACENETPPAATEACNGVDDNCDGTVDEGCTCTNGATQQCGSMVGQCRRGTQTCAGGAWGACTGETVAVAELCNALDDDCDGAADDGLDVGGACDSNDADQCSDDVKACAPDFSVACNDQGPAIAEACNGIDDNCDGRIDEGCSCTQGATQSCGDDTGACMAGTQTCTAGAWGACVGATGPVAETCNGQDDDCNGMTDDGLPMLTCGVGTCARSTPACMNGTPQTCTAGTPGTETCNGLDDDCDGTADDGVAPMSCGMGACVRMAACSGGTFGTCTPGTPGTETCNNIDDDCNGVVDNNVAPVTCGMGACQRNGMCTNGTPTCMMGAPTAEVCNNLDDDCDGVVDDNIAPVFNRVGQCAERTTCVNGMPVTIGTFVGSGGTAGGAGTRAARLSTITAAIANAQTIGGGADVCVCANAGAGGAYTTSENVSMVEGTSILGGFNCATWDPAARNLTTFPTTVQDVDADGLNINAGITTVTALDRVNVRGLNSADVAATVAISITDASPTLEGVVATGGVVGTSVALRVLRMNAASSPVVTGSTFTGGTAVAASIGAQVNGGSPRFTNTNFGATSGNTPPRDAIGFDCIGCAGTQLTGGLVSSASATVMAAGFRGVGDLSNFVATGTRFNGGASNVDSRGVLLNACMGAPQFVLAGVGSASGGMFGGGSIPSGGPNLVGLHVGFDASGAMCAPVVTGGVGTGIRGCEFSGTCSGVDCSGGAQCTVTNVPTITGATAGGNKTYGMRFSSGARGAVSGNDISAGQIVVTTGDECAGVEANGSTATFDDNSIRACFQRGGAPAPTGKYYGVWVRGLGRPTFTNDVILDQVLTAPVDVVHIDTQSTGPAAGGAVFHSNTIEYCSTIACTQRNGVHLVSTPGGFPSATGIFRNNVIQRRATNAGTQCIAFREADMNADPQFFENNDLFDTTATALYVDEGATNLSTAVAINGAMNGAGSTSANFITDCLLDATWHLPAAPTASPCVNTGTATGAPARDFDGMPRPGMNMFDVGADER